jgi:hypothetical protein
MWLKAHGGTPARLSGVPNTLSAWTPSPNIDAKSCKTPTEPGKYDQGFY